VVPLSLWEEFGQIGVILRYIKNKGNVSHAVEIAEFPLFHQWQSTEV